MVILDKCKFTFAILLLIQYFVCHRQYYFSRVCQPFWFIKNCWLMPLVTTLLLGKHMLIYMSDFIKMTEYTFMTVQRTLRYQTYDCHMWDLCFLYLESSLCIPKMEAVHSATHPWTIWALQDSSWTFSSWCINLQADFLLTPTCNSFRTKNLISFFKVIFACTETKPEEKGKKNQWLNTDMRYYSEKCIFKI